MQLRPALFALASSTALMLATPTARANPDPTAKPACSENCVDAGYEWAENNSPSGEADCASDNADFTAGCMHNLEEKQQAIEPALEEPAEAAEGTEVTDPFESDSDAAPVDPPQD